MPSIVKVDYGVFFGNTCSGVMVLLQHKRVLNSPWKERSFSYNHHGSNVQFYLFLLKEQLECTTLNPLKQYPLFEKEIIVDVGN